MTTTSKGKVSLFLAVLLASTFTITPIARAQVVSESATQAQVQELQNTLVALLTQLIAQLQAQITELVAQQASQATQLGAVQSQVNTVAEQTKPLTVSEPIEPSVSVNLQCENGQVRVNATVSSDTSSGYFYHWATTTPSGTRVGGSGTIWGKDANHPNGLSYLIAPKSFYWEAGVPKSSNDYGVQKTGMFDGTACLAN